MLEYFVKEEINNSFICYYEKKDENNDASIISNNIVMKLNSCLTENVLLAEKQHLKEIGNKLRLNLVLKIQIPMSSGDYIHRPQFFLS